MLEPSDPATQAPQPPGWTRAFELPTAGKVVGAGLHLAATSSAAIRRASLYIGLLALGAFGPAAVLMLVGIGRLLGDRDATSGPAGASIGAALAAYARGATILRVHDVRETVEALTVAREVLA